MIRRIARERAEGRIEPLVALPRAISQGATAEDDNVRARTEALRRALCLLLSEELRLAPEHIARVVERELRRVRVADEIVLKIHPDDLVLLKTCAEYSAELELTGRLVLCADANISRGGCLITSNLGEVDAQLETRLELALKLLTSGALG